MCFSKTLALSPRGICNTLDARADGIVIGESIVTIVLKRLAEAERDGDKIYAVIKGMGASSDGRDRSLTAPGVKGQMRALRRAYTKAGFSPATIGLVEAHATGTAEGDKVEIESLTQVLQGEGTAPRSCAIGSVKSMIGHTKSAAGLASLVKTALALHHKVLPPTLGVETPNPGLQKPDSPLFVNGTPRPWFSSGHPRRAGVNAFGFGGTNYHAVLEEYTGNYCHTEEPASYQDWPTELFCWQADDCGKLSTTLDQFKDLARRTESASLKDLAAACSGETAPRPSEKNDKAARLAIIATSVADLLAKIEQAQRQLSATTEDLADPRGLFYCRTAPLAAPRIAFLFPGQGSQYVNMLADAAIQFPFVHELFARSNELLTGKREIPLTSVIFPPQLFTEAEQRAQPIALAQTTTAQPAMGTADLALYHLLHDLGVVPDMVAGHSYGEYVALCAAGVIDEEELITLSEARARFILEGTGDEPGIMAAVEADAARVETELAAMTDIWIANINAPDQTVISGRKEAVQKAIEHFESLGIKIRQLPVGCAFHSPLIKPACPAMHGYLEKLEMRQPALTVFSNVTAAPHDKDPASIRNSLVTHLVSRVRFVEQIENMYQAGARIFVECGPGRVLTGLTGKILGDRPHLAVISNQRGRSAFTQLHFALAELFVHGVQFNLTPLFTGRLIQSCVQPLPKPSPTTWLLNGSGARPLSQPAPTPITPYRFLREDSAIPSCLDQSGRGPEQLSAAPGAPSPLPANGREAAMIGFQKLMRHFLDTQQSVMNRYLGAAPDTVTRPLTITPGKYEESSHLDDTAAEEIKSKAGKLTPAAPELGAQSFEKKPPRETDALPPSHDPLAELMAIVSDRTGYPPDMIDLDSDMEADLGIDSIKRVEILGEFLKGRDSAGGKDSSRSRVEKARTLRQILDWAGSRALSEKTELNLAALPSGGQGPSLPHPSPAGKEKKNETAHFLPRCLVIPVPLPPPAKTVPLPTSHPLLITDDGQGIAEALAARLIENNCQVLLLRSDELLAHPGKWTEYLLTESEITPLCAMIRKKYGGISGLIHLSPLQPDSSFVDMSAFQWHQRLTRELKPLFELLQDFAPDLRAKPGIVATVSSMGGDFGLGNEELPAYFPGHGALAGFMKTLAIEWPEVRIKALDISPNDPVDTIAGALFAELTADEPQVEIGLCGGKRSGLGIQMAALHETPAPGLHPDQDWVMVITGGARGITARVAIELARRFHSTLILIGRSPAPEPDADREFSHCATALEMKQAIIRRAQELNQPLTIAEVEESCRRLLAGREINEAMTAMQQAGSRVIYEQADVSDPAAFSALLDRTHQQYGRIDAIIHGAGIIEDKLFTDKKWESFARVFFTKADSTWVLANTVARISPRLLAFFSSVAGTFGNRGQCDYAAANEVMNKTALWLDHHGETRAVALNWGPWAGSGMASPEVQEQFLKRGVHLVDQDQGAEAFVRELLYGQRHEVEILLGSGPWIALATAPPVLGKTLPLLPDCPPPHSPGLPSMIRLTLDPQSHRYLNDHRLDGKPVLPAAMAVEIMAETAAALNPGWLVTAIHDVRVLKGIVIEGECREIVISARDTESSAETIRRLALGISEMEGGRLFYSGTVELRQSPYSEAAPHLPDPGKLLPLGMTVREAYEQWLFHGPLFQCITAIEGINEHGLRATLQTSRPENCLSPETPGDWIADPVLLDGGLQMALIWTRFHRDMTMLPSAMKAVHLYRPFVQEPEISSYLEVVERLHQQGMIFNIYFMDNKGALLAMIERLEATGSKALNRLTASSTPGSEGESA